MQHLAMSEIEESGNLFSSSDQPIIGKKGLLKGNVDSSFNLTVSYFESRWLKHLALAFGNAVMRGLALDEVHK